MKPVPISQYLDHIGRARADPQSPRRDLFADAPLAARLGADCESRSPLVFNRALLDAAMAARSRSLGERRQAAAADGRSSMRALLPQRLRETPPAPDFEASVAEAYERGWREGMAAARAENAETRTKEEAERRRRTLAERLDFQVNEYARLADAIEAGLAEIERRIAAAAARVLAPFLTEEVANQVVDELCAHVARLCAGGSPGLMKIRGPERLLAALRQRLSALAVDVEFVAEDGVEATVEAQSTIIRTALQPWADLIASLEG